MEHRTPAPFPHESCVRRTPPALSSTPPVSSGSRGFPTQTTWSAPVMLARHCTVLRPHMANKMLRLAISKRQMPYGTRMSIPPIPFALRCPGSFDPEPRVSMGSAARWTSRDARSLGRLESFDESERMHEGSRFWLPENRTSTRTMGPCLFRGIRARKPGLHSLRARRGFAISRSRRNHPSVAPSRRDPCRLFRIGSRPMSVGSGKHRLFAEGPPSCSRRF